VSAHALKIGSSQRLWLLMLTKRSVASGDENAWLHDLENIDVEVLVELNWSVLDTVTCFFDSELWMLLISSWFPSVGQHKHLVLGLAWISLNFNIFQFLSSSLKVQKPPITCRPNKLCAMQYKTVAVDVYVKVSVYPKWPSFVGATLQLDIRHKPQ